MESKKGSTMSKRLFIWIGLLILIGVISAAGWSTYITINRPEVAAPPPAVRGKIPQMPSTPSGSVSQKISVPPPATQPPSPAAEKASAPSPDAQEPTSLQPADQKPESSPEPSVQPEQMVAQNATPSEAATDSAEASPDSQDAVPDSKAADSADQPGEQTATSAETASARAPEQQEADQAPAVQKPSKESSAPAATDTTLAAAPAKEQATQTESQQLEAKPFTIQVGAYRNKQYAENAAAELKRKGYESYIFEDSDSKARPWYSVRFGQFANHKEARAALIAYQQKEQKQAIIARSGVR